MGGKTKAQVIDLLEPEVVLRNDIDFSKVRMRSGPSRNSSSRSLVSFSAMSEETIVSSRNLKRHPSPL